MTLHILVDVKNERLVDAMRDTGATESWKNVVAWIKHRRKHDTVENHGVLYRIAVTKDLDPPIKIVPVENDV